MNEKQLITSIKELKQIKPREEWASLLLSELLAEEMVQPQVNALPNRTADFMSAAWLGVIHHKMAYSFALFAFVIFGVMGFAQYTVPGDTLFAVKKITENSQANLTGKTLLAQNITSLNSRVQDLAQVSKTGKKGNIPSVITEIQANASQLNNTLKTSPADSKEIKEIAVTLKVLANVSGEDLKEDIEVQDLYKTVVDAQIADLQKATLTDEQKEVLVQTQLLAQEGKYPEALEKILLITQ